MPAAVVKDGTVTPKFRQGKISPPFLTAKFSPRNSPLAKFPPPLYSLKAPPKNKTPNASGVPCQGTWRVAGVSCVSISRKWVPRHRVVTAGTARGGS